MCWNRVVLRVSRQFRHPLLCQVTKPLDHNPSVKNGLALIWYHATGTTTRWLWAGMILHWAAYTLHWHINIILVPRKHENMSPFTGIRVITSYDELLHVLEPSSDRRPHSLKATPPPPTMLSDLTTRPWPVRHKRYGITHPAQQRDDSEQERFSIGLLTPCTGVCLSLHGT